MDRLTCMRTFMKTVEAGSISAAAIQLGLSSQVAGKQIRALEDSLGAQLLSRTTRSQNLTDSGQVFYERAKIILDEVEQAEALIAESRSRPRGKLRISAPVTFGSRGLAPALPEFLRQHPEVSVELYLTNRTVDLIEESYDIVFRTGELPDSSLVARRLGDYPLVLCASLDYLQRAAKLTTPDDLEHHECLVFSHTSLRTTWSFDGPEGRITIRISGRFFTDSGEALRAAAVAGMGIMLQPLELVADELHGGRLVRLLPGYEPCARSMHVVHASGRRATPKLRAFLDFAVRTFKYP